MINHEGPRPTGLWHNEQGSELRIEVGPEGRISGCYCNAVGFGAGETFEVTGYVAGHLIIFAVNFGKYDSLTSWVGHLVPGPQPEIRTLWQMTLESPDPRSSTDLWKTTWSGADTFRRGPAPPRAREHDRPGEPLPLSLG